MQFRYVNPHSVRHLVPSWVFDPFQVTSAMDGLFAQYFKGKKRPDPYRPLKFWVEINIGSGGAEVKLVEPTNEDDAEFCGSLYIDSQYRCLVVPLNALLVGHEKLAGSYSLYSHSFELDAPLSYVGLTKRTWFERFSQHKSDAGRGSHLLFHRAIREHQSAKMFHRVFLTGIDHDTAMSLEEEYIENISLYPLGLNMIPGGFAGMKYLGSLGFQARTAEQRDDELQRLVDQPDIGGKPNPLCAARWEVDQDFVNRVICGHSGRLTVDQVRLVRMLTASGKPSAAIAEYIGDKQSRVERVASGDVYARVA